MEKEAIPKDIGMPKLVMMFAAGVLLILLHFRAYSEVIIRIRIRRSSQNPQIGKMIRIRQAVIRIPIYQN